MPSDQRKRVGRAGLEPATNGFAGGGFHRFSAIAEHIVLQVNWLSHANQRQPLRGFKTGHTRRISADQNMFATRGFRAAQLLPRCTPRLKVGSTGAAQGGEPDRAGAKRHPPPR